MTEVKIKSARYELDRSNFTVFVNDPADEYEIEAAVADELDIGTFYEPRKLQYKVED